MSTETVLANIGRWLRLAAALAAGLWGGLEPMFQLVVILAALDVATGFLAGWGQKTLNSTISARGMARKAQMLVLIGVAYAVDRYASLPVDIGALTCGFYAMHEGLSILENAGELGVPIPDQIREALARLNGTGGRGKQAEKANSG